MVVNAQECQHRDKPYKSSASIAIMSWHIPRHILKNIVLQAVNLYNEFAWAQENLMEAVDEKQVISF